MSGVLSRREIVELVRSGSLVVHGLDEDAIGPNGLDLSIGEEYCQITPSTEPVDTADKTSVRRVYVCGTSRDVIELLPNNRYLLHTREYIRMPEDVVGLVNLRSTYARLGLLAPPTVVDAGFEGQITIEVAAPPYPLRLHFGERILHLVLVRMEGSARYDGRYQGQTGVTLPRLGV